MESSMAKNIGSRDGLVPRGYDLAKRQSALQKFCDKCPAGTACIPNWLPGCYIKKASCGNRADCNKYNFEFCLKGNCYRLSSDKKIGSECLYDPTFDRIGVKPCGDQLACGKEKKCKSIGKCSTTDECFDNMQCSGGICTIAPTGKPCKNSNQCAEDFTCQDKKCAPRQNFRLGEKCSSNEQCSKSLECFENTCVFWGTGRSCNPETGCALGLVCYDNKCGYRRYNKVGDHCDSGLDCQSANCDNNKCAAPSDGKCESDADCTRANEKCYNRQCCKNHNLGKCVSG